ncbi:MAG: glutamate--tRNA ligase [Candidatus Taylorbacteria bacterium]|nr:glutamate--tRNA ligase [Candidatus Taylorbacteria bacterium]
MKNNNSQIVTRFPPSPTGFLHIGRARTALFNYLFSKQNNGQMIFRFEDTDKARSKKEFEEIMIESLIWLDIKWDNEIIPKQSERVEIYKKYLKKIIDEGKAYISKEKIEEGEKAGQENEVVRFKNPNVKLTFTDLIRGDITFDTTDLGDFVIARNIDDPLYHLTVVVDDFDMKVTHIIRGDDGISNTPRQILIQQAIGAPQPIYAHLPLILAPDKSKLSGRHGAVSVTDYREKGYLPEALINYLALLGWNPGTTQEIFSMDELIRDFDLNKVQKSGAIFNIEKLNWINKEYLKKLDRKIILSEIKKRLEKKYSVSEEYAQKLLPVILDRINVYADVDIMVEAGELDYFFNEPTYPKEKLLWKGESDLKKVSERLAKVSEILKNSEYKTDTDVKALLMPYAEKEGKGNVLWPVRFALSGKDKSPDPFTIISLLEKEKMLERLKNAIHALQ